MKDTSNSSSWGESKPTNISPESVELSKAGQTEGNWINLCGFWGPPTGREVVRQSRGVIGSTIPIAVPFRWMADPPWMGGLSLLYQHETTVFSLLLFGGTDMD